MIDDQWKELFPPHILQRGIEYHRNGNILEIKNKENEITAKIRGTEIYTVSLLLCGPQNKIRDFFCDCPYGEDGTPCKHLAALLYALESGILNKTSTNNQELSIEEMVRMLSDHQKEELLIQLAKKDSYIRNRIQLSATKKLPQTQTEQWKLDLQNITDSARNKYGYIDYDEAYDYCISLLMYLENQISDLIYNRLFRDAFELTCMVFETGVSQEIDDSDGGLSILADACMNSWNEILTLSDADLQQEMFRWFTIHYSDHDLSQMFLEEYLFDAPWKEELFQDILNFIDQQIRHYADDRFSEYHLNKMIGRKIRWLGKSGTDQYEIDNFFKENHHLSEVRKIQIANAIQNENYESALFLLEESKELDQDKIGLVASYSKDIIKIYETINNISELKKELEYYIFTFYQSDLVYIKKLKALLTPSEWKETRKQLLNSSSIHWQKYPLLKEEEMYEEMISQIEATHDIRTLEEYESLLKEKFPLRCKDIYISHLQWAMERAYNRKSYWSVIQTLKRLKKYPNGNAAAQKLAQNWKQKFPRRTAMIDELNKAGF